MGVLLGRMVTSMADHLQDLEVLLRTNLVDTVVGAQPDGIRNSNDDNGDGDDIAIVVMMNIGVMIMILVIMNIGVMNMILVIMRITGDDDDSGDDDDDDDDRFNYNNGNTSIVHQ